MGFHRLCNCALQKKGLAEMDVTFVAAEVASYMYFVTSGSLTYCLAAETSTDLGIQNDDEVTMPVTSENWISEPVLWTPWIHMGTLQVIVASELIFVDANEFGKVASSQSQVCDLSSNYGHKYVELLNSMTRRGDKLSDIATNSE